MGLIDIFKKKEERKEQSKCARCFRPIAGSVYTIDNNNYCRECYNRKMAVIQQTGGQPVAVTQKIPPKKALKINYRWLNAAQDALIIFLPSKEIQES